MAPMRLMRQICLFVEERNAQAVSTKHSLKTHLLLQSVFSFSSSILAILHKCNTADTCHEVAAATGGKESSLMLRSLSAAAARGVKESSLMLRSLSAAAATGGKESSAILRSLSAAAATGGKESSVMLRSLSAAAATGRKEIGKVLIILSSEAATGSRENIKLKPDVDKL